MKSGDFMKILTTLAIAIFTISAQAADFTIRTRSPGEVFSFSGSACPAGSLPADGQSLSSATYPELFAAIGRTHGGTAPNFNLPDYRGRFLRGVDGSAGRDPDSASRIASGSGGEAATGNAVGTVQGHAFQTHTHAQNPHTHVQDAHGHWIGGATGTGSVGHAQWANSSWSNGNDASPNYSVAKPTVATNQNATAVNQNASASGANSQGSSGETRPLNITVLYCVVH